jgi:hypothetical protein
LLRFRRRRREREKATGERKGKISALPPQPSAIFFAVVI